MLGLTSRLIVEFRTGFFPAGVRIGTITSDDISSASYSTALNTASSFELNCAAARLPGAVNDGGYMLVFESITDGDTVREVTVGQFAIASLEYVWGAGGEWMARVRGESAICWELSSVGNPYPDYGGGWLFQALSFAQLHTHKERGFDVQIPVSSVGLLSRQTVTFDDGGTMMDRVSTATLQMGLLWRALDEFLTRPVIQIFDIPPLITPYGYNETVALIEPREPGGPSGIFGDFADNPIYEWSEAKMMTDFSRRYDALYAWGGRWNEDGTDEDFIVYPIADSLVEPYVSAQETFGRMYRQVTRLSGGAPRPRRTMSLNYSNIRPFLIPPLASEVNVARQNLVETAYKALTSLFLISRHNYQVVVPGSMLAHTRAGFRVNGQFRFPSISTEQPYETLRCLAMNVTWQGDGATTTTLELSNGFESLLDFRASDYGKDRYVPKQLLPAPSLTNTTTITRVNYSVTTPVTYTFPIPFISPPLVTVWDAPSAHFPVILSVTATEVVFIFSGYVAFAPTFVDLAITPPI